MMFLGQHEHSLDKKGRIIMPSRFREDLGDPFVITFGLDKCLFVYSMEEWEKLADNLQGLPYYAVLAVLAGNIQRIPIEVAVEIALFARRRLTPFFIHFSTPAEWILIMSSFTSKTQPGRFSSTKPLSVSMAG